MDELCGVSILIHVCQSLGTRCVLLFLIAMITAVIYML